MTCHNLGLTSWGTRWKMEVCTNRETGACMSVMWHSHHIIRVRFDKKMLQSLTSETWRSTECVNTDKCSLVCFCTCVNYSALENLLYYWLINWLDTGRNMHINPCVALHLGYISVEQWFPKWRLGPPAGVARHREMGREMPSKKQIHF